MKQMRILLVEPDYRKGGHTKFREVTDKNFNDNNNNKNDEKLWYPPLGLMKLASYHKQRGDYVKFIVGCDKDTLPEANSFQPELLWDRIYITTLFTFDFKKIIKTINFYKKAVGGTTSKIFVGGIMASLMPKEIFQETGIYPMQGIISSSKQLVTFKRYRLAESQRPRCQL